MKYALLVAWHEFAENAKTKGFWIGICVFPIIIFITIQATIFLKEKATPTRYFILVDQSGQYEKVVDENLERNYQKQVLESLNAYAARYTQKSPVSGKDSKSTLVTGMRTNEAAASHDFADINSQTVENFIQRGGADSYLSRLRSSLSVDAPKFRMPRRPFQRLKLPDALRSETNFTILAEALKPFLRGGKKIEADGQFVDLDAAILVPSDIEKRLVRSGRTPAAGFLPRRGIQFWASNWADMRLREEVERGINDEVQRREYEARGVDYTIVKQVRGTYAPFTNLNPKKETGQEKVDVADMIRQWAPTAFVYLLWVAIFAIVQMLLNNTVEEKSNRLIEVLLSSVTPGELMMGKLMGIAAVGLTMVGSWILALVGVLAWKSSSQSEIAGQLFQVLRTSGLLPAFGIYFLLGFVMYAAAILSIGSVCNTIKESQNYMGVITLFMMVPLLTMTFIPKDPNGTLATVLSWIPLYTPFVMMNRITADPPLFDLIGTMILLLLTDALVLWLAVKIFRIGVLRTGQPPRLMELVRWIRH